MTESATAPDTGTEGSALAQLWAQYAETGSRDDRNALVLAYGTLVRTIVARIPGAVRAHWDNEDLVSFGLIGLIDAVRRWDPASPLQRFKPYAVRRIRGAIFDELRRLDWLPRTVRQRVIAYRSTVDALSSELGRVPGSDEVFKSLEVDAREGHMLLKEVQSAQLLHLQHEAEVAPGEEDVLLVDLIASSDEEDPEERVLESERRAVMMAAITRLPERERMVVTLHFLDGLTQEQVGKLLGVSNSRICQIQASAVETLRRLLGGITDHDETRTG